MNRIAKKPGAYHHGDLRRVLLETAVRVVEKEGVGALSLHAIAKKAGVSAGAPYHHFESRDQLLAAIAEDGFTLLVETMKSQGEAAEERVRSESKVPRRDRLAVVYLGGLGEGYIRFALAHPGHFRVMFRPEVKRHLRDAPAVVESFSLLTQAVDRCRDAQAIVEGDSTSLVLLAWSAVHGAAALWVDGPLSEDGLVPDAEALGPMISNTLLGLLAR
jgi:AcrR family transcriptional regulator